MFLRPQSQAHTTVLRGCGAFKKWSLAGGSRWQVWNLAVEPSPSFFCLSLFPALHTQASLCCISCCNGANCSALLLPLMMDCDPLKPWAKINLSVLKSYLHKVFCHSNKESSQATLLDISLLLNVFGGYISLFPKQLSPESVSFPSDKSYKVPINHMNYPEWLQFSIKPFPISFWVPSRPITFPISLPLSLCPQTISACDHTMA